MSEFREALRRAISGILALDGAILEQMEQHFALLQRWNARMNLTSVIEPREAARKHYAESLILGSMLPDSARVWVDLGSGAGFPGFPVAALRKDLQLILLDADQRKASFLRECRDIVPGFRVVTVRGDQYLGECEGVISRAVHADEVFRFADRRPSVEFIGQLVSLSGEKVPSGLEKLTWKAMPWDSDSVAIVWRRST